MRLAILSLTFVAAFLSSRPVIGQSIPAEVLSKVKRACVFIRTDEGEGTGFLIERNGQKGIIATAAHVVCNDNDVPLSSPKVYFNSGSDNAKSLTARHAGFDTIRDIAFLEVETIDLPDPVQLAPDAKLVETMDVIVAGFPYGGMLSLGAATPAMTVSKGAISSIRSNPKESVTVLQLDVNVSPGNSGGPVLNDVGKVIGIVQAKTAGSPTAFASTAQAILSDLAGNVGELDAEFFASDVNLTSLELSIKGRVIDPHESIKSVEVRVGSIDAIDPSKQLKKDEWSTIPHKATFPAKRNKDSFELRVSLPTKGLPLTQTFVQLVLLRKENTAACSPPRLLQDVINNRDQLKQAQAGPRPGNPPRNQPGNPPGNQPPGVPVPGVPVPVVPDTSGNSNAVAPDSSLTVYHHAKGSSRASQLRTHKVANGILSRPFESEAGTLRRVMIEPAMYAPVLAWSPKGDRLALAGQNLTVLDFPQATHVETVHLDYKLTWASFYKTNTKILAADASHLFAYDFNTKKITEQWDIRGSFTDGEPQYQLRNNSDQLLYTLPQTSKRLFGYDLKSSSQLVSFDLAPDPKAKIILEDIFVPRNGKSAYSREGHTLMRFELEKTAAKHVESVTLPFNAGLENELCNTSDEEVLLLLGKSQLYDVKKTQVFAVAAQNLKNYFQVEVPDFVRVVYRNPVQRNFILAGMSGLWFWEPRSGTLEFRELPGSMPYIHALSLHPQFQTLAVLCTPNSTTPMLYLLDLNTPAKAGGNQP